MPRDIAYGGSTLLVPPDVLSAGEGVGSDLTGLVAAFRSAALPSACIDQNTLLDRLSSNVDANARWRLFFSGKLTSHPFVILGRILELKNIADGNGNSPERMREISQELGALGDAARNLEVFFNQFPYVIVGDDGETAETARSTNENMRNVRASMRWAQAYLRARREKIEHVFSREFPAGQKRNQPILAFAIQLCREFDGAFKQPGYSLAGAVAGALYNRDPFNTENLAKAYRADRQMRPLAGRFWFAADLKS